MTITIAIVAFVVILAYVFMWSVCRAAARRNEIEEWMR